MDSSFFDYEKFKNDNIRAIDAKFEAQKIAFAPLTYQAVRTMLETGILSEIENAGDAGITRGALSEKTKISEYGVGVLCEMALGMDVIKLSKDSVPGSDEKEKFVLGKIGWMLLEDNLTKVNFWFSNDICYEGAFKLKESILNGKPEGLKVFGDKWTLFTRLFRHCRKKQRNPGLTLIIFTATLRSRRRFRLFLRKNLSQLLISAETRQNGRLPAVNTTRMLK